uniref:Uncharacterized protein n=1 Tax=Equus asinus asinus TaxID=83772 RepID=A0A8C4N173_EQUAS
MGTLGQCMENTEAASRLVRVQSRQNLMVPEPRSLNLFTRKPPRNVPPPPAGTTSPPPPAASPPSPLRGARPGQHGGFPGGHPRP